MDKFKDKFRIPSARLAAWDYSCPGLYFITICTKDRNHFFGEIKNDEMYLNEIGKIADEFWAEIPDHFKNVSLGEFVIMPNHLHGIIIIENKNNGRTVETGHALSPDENTNKTTTETGQYLSADQNIDDSEPETRQTLSANENINNTGAKTGHIMSADDNINNTGTETGHALSPDENINKTETETETGLALSLPEPNEPTRHFRFRNQGKNTISAMVGSFKSAVTNSARKINPDFGWQSRFHDHIIRSHEEFIRISNYIRHNPANWRDDKFYK